MTLDHGRPPVVVERTYSADPETVFAAWTDVAQLSRWWGCATDMLWNVHEWDVRVGGPIRVSLDFDGTPFEVSGSFVEITAPNRLVYDWDEGQRIVVHIDAADSPVGGSTMRIEHHGLPDEQMDTTVTGGWSASVVQIEAVLS